jgi:hypothetical protein
VRQNLAAARDPVLTVEQRVELWMHTSDRHPRTHPAGAPTDRPVDNPRRATAKCQRYAACRCADTVARAKERQLRTGRPGR